MSAILAFSIPPSYACSPWLGNVSTAGSQLIGVQFIVYDIVNVYLFLIGLHIYFTNNMSKTALIFHSKECAELFMCKLGEKWH